MSDTFAPPTPGRAYESSIHAAAHDAALAAAAGLHGGAPAAAPASASAPTPEHTEPAPAPAAPTPAPVAPAQQQPQPQPQQQQPPQQPPLDEARLPKGVALAPGGKVRLTDYAAIANAPLPAEGNGSFSNYHLCALVLLTPAVLLRFVPFVKVSSMSWLVYFVFVALFGVPVTVAYWTVMSAIGPRINDKVELPGRPIEYYLQINDASLRAKYNGHKKIPMQVFHDAYFEGQIDLAAGRDMLEVLEYRLDWASMAFTPELFKFVFSVLIPDVIRHTEKQDMEQVRDHYDRGDDFYGWFLGPQMIYTSGMISDIHKKETLEELQDNKLSVVCSKLQLKASDKLLDIGCGWGTLTAFAAKNFGCDATGVTLARNQTKFGNERIARAGVSPDKARILCMDYRDIPVEAGHYDKIVSLEMAEHVGIRHYAKFLRDIYTRLDDDGTFLLQVAGLRPKWQYWDLVWGLFMNKYIFRGADASCSIGWVINQLEAAGFEVRSADVLGVHYSATIHRWLENWQGNKEKIVPKYGEKLYRIWDFFLASSTIIAREGGSSVFQIVTQKNLNATHRVEGVLSHNSIHAKPQRDFVSVYK